MAIRPAAGNISAPYGWRIHPISKQRQHHDGEDIGWGNGGGTTLRAPISGKVVSYGWAGGYGNRMIIRSGTTDIWLCHMASASVRVGQNVSEGQTVGVMGATGTATGVHVHWEVWINGARQDPAKWLKGNGSGGSIDTTRRQEWLNRSRGTKLAVDGIQGAATTKAIKDYQAFLKKSYGYKGNVDGIWGPATQAAHQKYYDEFNKPKPKPSKVTTATFGRVDVVQKALREGYPLYASRLAVDNIDGPATIAAVKEFQRRAGLKVDGIAGPETRRALGV